MAEEDTPILVEAYGRMLILNGQSNGLESYSMRTKIQSMLRLPEKYI